MSKMAVKNIFKKPSSSTLEDGHADSPKKNRISSSGQRTPPVTPSPTKHESNISVRVIPSQREPTATTSPLEQKIPDDDSTLFTAVLGIGCGSPLWDGPGSSLTPIPEENGDFRTEWGTPPSFEDNSVDSLNHDDFEVVLQTENASSVDTLQLKSEIGPIVGAGLPLFCQPCETNNVSKSVGSDEKRKKKRFEKLSRIMNRKGKSKKRKDALVVESDSHETRQQTHTPRESKEQKETIQNTKQRTTLKSPKSLRKIQVGKVFHARFHKKRHAEGSRRMQSTESHDQLNQKSTQAHTSKGKRSKRGRWKCVQDQKCNKVYYYHTRTREVTWDRPRDFVEWRVANDVNRKQFFYNTITKETSWDMPEGFEQWAEVTDNTTGKPYYYNVLTRETSWEIPAALMHKSGKVQNARCEQNEEAVVDATCTAVPNDEIMKNCNGIKKSDYVIEIAGSKHDFNTARNQDNELADKGIPARSAIQKYTPEEPTQEINFGSKHVAQSDEPPKITLDDDQARLAKLLSTYCPDEEDNNAQLLDKSIGQEKAILMGLETLVEDTPFDELRLAIFSYVKSTLKDMGEEPFDERKIRKNQRPPVTQFSPKRMNRVTSNIISVAGYSLGSRALSHVTGTTNLTEQTNRINNTSNQTNGSKITNSESKDALAAMNERWNNMNANNSYDDMTDVTDDDAVDTKVFLDMTMVGSEEALQAKKPNKYSAAANGTKYHSIKSPSAKNSSRPQAGDIPSASQIGSDSMSDTPQDAETLESAYAADEDDETDTNGWDEEAEDEVSALSDSFSPSITKRYTKEKKIITMQEEPLMKKKVR